MGRADPNLALTAETNALSLTNVFDLVSGMPYQGNSLLISWMKRPLGLSDPSSATDTVVFAPSGTDIGAASEPRAVLTQPGSTEFTFMLVSLSSAARWIVNMLIAAFDAL
jgi:hypothetical protein